MAIILSILLGICSIIFGYFLGSRKRVKNYLKDATVQHGPHTECHYCHHIVARYTLDAHNYPICANCLSECK